MRATAARHVLSLVLAVVVLLFVLSSQKTAWAGGPLVVGGTFGVDGVPMVWDTSSPIQYATDGGMLGSLTNQTANDRVEDMFRVWEDIPTASIQFNRSGQIAAAGFDGDVDTMAEFDLFECDGPNVSQNPIIYDADGSLFTELGFSSGVIGFAGPCDVNSVGNIIAGRASLNGKFIDGDNTNGELSSNEFEQAFVHEFGHFSGLDHSQINREVLGQGNSCQADDHAGLPLMFPILSCEARLDAGLPIVGPDDVAWISRLYPSASFAAEFGLLTGTVFFSDGLTPAQGVNVIARAVDDPNTPENESRRVAYSAVSGLLFTGNPGQALTGTNTGGDSFGSRNPTLIGFYEIPVTPGSYTVEVESILPTFSGGSGVGPVNPPIPSPGPAEFWNLNESATDDPAAPGDAVTAVAGGTVSDIDVILNNTAARFDGFDAAGRNDSTATATPIGNGTLRMSISPYADPPSGPGNPDHDYYRLSAEAGALVTVDILARRSSQPSKLDSVLEILDAQGVQFATGCRNQGSSDGLFGETDPTPDAFDDPCINDDLLLGVVVDSKLEFQVPGSSGTVNFFLHVLDWRGDARPDLGYDLVVSGASDVVENPVPALSVLSPSSVLAGGQAFTLTVNGSSFVSGAVVQWNGSNRSTTFVSTTQLLASISAGDLAAPGAASVTVVNPAPGGGASNALTFTVAIVSDPVPAAAFQTVVPHTASGGGFLTRLIISNLVNSSNAININRISQGGVVVQSTSTTLQPAGTLLIADQESQRTEPITVEWFAIGSEQPIAASVLFDFDSASLGLTENFRTAVGTLASPPLTVFTLPVRVATVEVTVGAALANLSDSSNTVTLRLLDESGTMVAEDSITLGPFGQTAFSLQDRAAFHDIILAEAEFVGALTVTTADPNQPVAALVVGNNLRQLFSLPVSSGASQ